MGEPAICLVCAYRALCQKKFTLSPSSGGYFQCPEFTRDLTIGMEEKGDDDEVEENSKED